MEVLKLKIQGKIAILEFDQPDFSVNLLNSKIMEELYHLVNQLKSESHRDTRGLLIVSKKDNIFIAGADIKEIEYIDTVDQAKEKAQRGKEILNVLNSLKIPTVAVINGACLGGGFELTLACKYRVASFSESVKIGLPEVKLGIIPGFGGMVRLPKLVGISRAVSMILSGQIVSARNALRYGIVDKLFPQKTLLDDSIDFINCLINDAKFLPKKPKKKILQLFLENTSLGRIVLFNQAKKNVLKKTKGFYPAPLKAIEVFKKTQGINEEKAFAIESEAFGELAVTRVSKNLIKVFYLNEEFKKYCWVDSKFKPENVKKCGVLGAGVMGGGITQLVSFNDIPTRIKDISNQALATALKTASSLFKYALKRRKIKKHDFNYKFGLISPTLTYRGLENADIIIEAVVEDLNIKKKVFKELSEVVLAKTILASNTSALSIAEMAKVCKFPQRVVGLHFFNPVHRMPLVEVIKADLTSDQTLNTTIAFARKLGKVVIVVKDVAGFLINRILLSYLNEAGFLIDEGMKMDFIDSIARKFGMPMGPIELIDEVGIDVGYKVAVILEEAYPNRMKVCKILKAVKDKGLLGKKNKLGFYKYKNKKRIPNCDIYSLVSLKGTLISRDDALKRMIYVMINEAARCLEEGVVDTAGGVDIGMIMGIGFPPHRGGLLRYADSLGLDTIVNELNELSDKFKAERLKPCSNLVDMKNKNKKFYK